MTIVITTILLLLLPLGVHASADYTFAAILKHMNSPYWAIMKIGWRHGPNVSQSKWR
jgi:ABC-type sugar transport system substrate-binding protein